MAELFKQVANSEEMIYLQQIPRPSSKTNFHVENQAQALRTQVDLAVIQEQAYQEAYEKGFSEGLKAGNEQGHQQGLEQLYEKQTQLLRLIDALPEAISQQRLTLQTEIADIVMAIIQPFFIHQQQSKETIGLQINSVIRQLNQEQILEIALHPQDLSLLQQGQMQLDLRTHKNIRIVASDNLQLGGCLVKSEHGLFDASIAKQIDRLKDVLLQIKQGPNHD